MPRIVFTPSGLDGEVEAGTTVLAAARALGVDLDSVCGGRGVCGRCQVVVASGRFAKWDIETSLDAVVVEAQTKRTARQLEEGQVLGCAARVDHDTVIDVPPMSQVHRQVIRKSVDLEGVVLDPLFELHYLELEAPVLGREHSMSRQLLDALVVQHGVAAEGVAPHVLPFAHGACRGLTVTVAVETAVKASKPTAPTERTGGAVPAPRGRIVAVWPGFVDAAYGIAVDVGSTTIAGYLVDLTTGEVVSTAGRMNPQIRFGEDLMSRVSYVLMNPGGDIELTESVRAALRELVGELLSEADVEATSVLDMTVVGNPIMHHVLLGIDPTPLGLAPFILATDDAVHLRADDLDLPLPFAAVYAAPCIAGHVGADTAAAMLAEGPHRSSHQQLLVDVGTNAEIVLGSKDRQFAASSPTGPAFEGAQLSCGQRATAGAVERVRVDRDTLEPRYKVIGSDLWSDDAGFDEATAELNISGICGSGIIEVIAEMYLAGVIDTEGVIRPENAERTDRVQPDGRTYTYVLRSGGEGRPTLAITQNDVRAIQLAKAALRAGIDLLVEHAGSPEVHDVRLAGAFGSHIDPLYALVLGLVPDCPVDCVRAVGNAAGAGAVRALLSGELRAEMERAVRIVDKIETATEPRFQELFVAAMAFPHASVPTPHLAQAVDLPVRVPAAGSADRGRRRRRTSPAPDPAEHTATQLEPVE